MAKTLTARLMAAIAALCLAAGSAWAGPPEVVDVVATMIGEQDGVEYWRFEVTVQHEDEGWDHYVDRWEIEDEQGALLATRVLYHPHVDEQPFTRSLSSVEIPMGTERVVVRAHDSVHGYGDVEVVVTLMRE